MNKKLGFMPPVYIDYQSLKRRNPARSKFSRSDF